MKVKAFNRPKIGFGAGVDVFAVFVGTAVLTFTSVVFPVW